MPVSLAALLALGAGLALTALMFIRLANTEADERMKALEHAADVRQAALREEFDDALNGLTVINSLFSGDESLSRRQFDELAAHLAEQSSFVHAFAFVRVISPEKRPAFESQMRLALPGFAITEIMDGARVTAGDKLRYHVIEYATPAAVNDVALGLDVSSMPGMESVLERARRSGQPSATRMFSLPPQSGGQRAFAAYLPLFRKGATGGNGNVTGDVAGYHAVVLRAAQLVESAQRGAARQHWPEADISVWVDDGEEKELVYRSGGPAGSATGAYTPSWTGPDWAVGLRPASAVRSFDLAGVRWHVVTTMSSDPAGYVGHAPLSAWMALLGGALVSILLALYLQSLAVRAADLSRANDRLKEDIAARKRIEHALRESEARFQHLADLSSDWYWEQDAELRFTLVSGETIFGSTPTNELLGKARWELPLEVDESDFEAHMSLLAERKPFSDLEYRVRDASGRTCWMSVSGEPLFAADGAFAGYRGTGKDITQRKEAEQALMQSQTELRELAAHLARVKEDERKRIAREIHDDLGQHLLALRIDVSLLDGATRLEHPDLNKSICALMEQVDNTIRSTRAIINDLRPAVLDRGLQGAIEWQVQQFGQRSGVCCVLETEGNDIDRVLDEEAATSVFRILQESLTNVSRHAYATHVNIRLRSRYGYLELEIEDNGVGGFPGNMRKPRSFGLIGIRERVYAMSGSFSVASVPGEGTTLTVTIPASATPAVAAVAA